MDVASTLWMWLPSSAQNRDQGLDILWSISPVSLVCSSPFCILPVDVLFPSAPFRVRTHGRVRELAEGAPGPSAAAANPAGAHGAPAGGAGQRRLVP